MTTDPTISIRFLPDARSVRVAPGTNVLDAARDSGIVFQAACGGLGICDTCRVRFLSGNPASIGTVERDALEVDELEEGYRLACQTVVTQDATVEIPPSSRLTGQRMVVEGQLGIPELDPSIVLHAVDVKPPSGEDLRPDIERLLDALGDDGPKTVDPQVAAEVSQKLRAHAWAGRLVMSTETPVPTLIGLLPTGRAPLGVAIDVGSTRLAGYLVDLESGKLLAKSGVSNPQIPFGEDVVSRISYAAGGPDQAERLRRVMIEEVDGLIAGLCAEAGVGTFSIVDVVAVGNTAMHHLLLGWPVEQLGRAPFVPVASMALETRAREVGFDLSAGTRIYLPPLIAGFVGSDHVAVQTALALDEAEGPWLVLDIGTNTEVSLVVNHSIWSCSCASGPAFEGAHIKHGMRAAPGAVERVRLEEGRLVAETIAHAPAVGICGSGILDAVAMLRAAGAVGRTGKFARDGLVETGANGTPVVVLVPAGETADGRDIVVTREDVHEIQLAKAAIRAGVDLLLYESGIPAVALKRITLAGAFGSYLTPENILAIGMLPDVPVERIEQVGNAAGVGAVHMLLSRAARRKAEHMARQGSYIELTTHARFPDTYLDALML